MAPPLLVQVWAAAAAVVVALAGDFQLGFGDQSKLVTDPVEAQALNAIFKKWNISAKDSKAKWNLTDDICSGLPSQIGQNFESPDRNPYIVCDCENDGNTCHITKLKVLELQVVGTIPDELKNLTRLENLQIARNYLTGPLPSFIGNFSRMQYLSVGRNFLSGPVPKELGKLKALKSLGIDTCNFSGPLPAELGNLTYLEQMYIFSMGVSGEIPSSFVNLTNLQTWWAGDNNFGGPFPEFLGDMTNLQSIKFHGNSFQGPIPTNLARLTRLTLLYLMNLSNGSSSLTFIKNMTLLESLVLRDSRITGSLPADIGSYSNMSLLDLSFNNLTGELPSSLFNLPRLTDLYLGNNSFHGELPKNKSSTLLNVDLSYNDLSGDIPSWLSDKFQMNLAANKFDDSSNGLPSKLRCLQKDFPCYRNSPAYYSFDIDCGGDGARALDGTYYEADNWDLGAASYAVKDDYRWAVSSTGKFLGTDRHNYTEKNSSNILNTGDSELFQSVRVSPSSLRYYGLALENGNYSIALKFAEIAFPDDYSLNSHGRRIFDIYIQGSLVTKDFNIKKEAGNRSFTAVIWNHTVNVTNNYLEVHLFWGGKGTTAIPHWGYNGPSISAISVSPNFKHTVSNHLPRKNKRRLIIGVTTGVSSAMFIALFIAILVWRKRQNLNDEELDELSVRPYTFSLAELKSATKEFSIESKLGEGGFGVVFKGKLQDGRLVAVKKLSMVSFHGKRQFITEIATISTVQHRNLVKLYGCCYEGRHRLLVYEFLENGSLDIALFGNSSFQLDWPSRYNICIGTAKGLSYLHEESRTRIIHRDVKSSNILLDAELNPKLSDFGLAKLYDDKMTHISTKVAGTIGYLAPEYALRGHLTEKADIFGFGIVILEMLSGKPNTRIDSAGKKMHLLDWAWELHEHNKDLELMDPRLTSYDKDEAIRMIAVAFLCTQSDPTRRPPMSRVVAMLIGETDISSAITKPAYLADWKYDKDFYDANPSSVSSLTFESSGQFDSSERALLPGEEVVNNSQLI